MRHIPVLLQEVVAGLDPQAGQVLVDGTVGFGGHARAICSHLGADGVYVGIDQDDDALSASAEVLSQVETRVHLLKGSFRNIDTLLAEVGIDLVDGILLDLGLSSHQLDTSGRGFSFSKEEPLMMTFAKESSLDKMTASDIVNTWDEADIANVIYGYGEERFSRRIARAIILARDKAPITTTKELAQIVEQAVPAWYRRRKIHPATKTFQALRIAVNDELQALEEGMEAGWRHLKPGGKMAIITFHGLEAVRVKNFFKFKKADGLGEILTKKAIKPSTEEVAQNPRSRSAQLRIIRKNDN